MPDSSTICACAALITQQESDAALMLCTIDRLRDKRFRKLLIGLCETHPRHFGKMGLVLKRYAADERALAERSRMVAGSQANRGAAKN